MTAIAYRDGELAADTACYRGNVIAGHTRKIRRLANGDLFAAAGPSAYCEAVCDWLASGEDKPQPLSDRNDFHAIIIQPSGAIRMMAGDLITHDAPNAPYHAFGAHGEFLLGAMAAGASAGRAVELAIKLGDSADGDVQVERV